MAPRSLTGLSLPLEGNEVGGLRTVEGEEYLAQLIRTALSPCDNTNPFQQKLGIPEDVVFDLSTPALIARVRHRIVRLFEGQLRPQGLAVLLSADLLDGPVGSGDTGLRIRYLSLLTRRPGSVDVPARA